MPKYNEKPARFARALMAMMVLAALSAPAFSYVVYLKDGSRLTADGPPVVEGSEAIITLQSGTRTSIAASEIDFEKTRQANKENYGSAVVIGSDGETIEGRPPAATESRRERVSDLINRGAVSRRERTQARREHSVDPTDLRNWQRVPFRDNLDLVAEIQGVFHGQGFESVGIYRGTGPGRLLVELTTNSESAVFHGLKVAAGALSRAQGLHPQDLEALELVLATSDRERAGEFILTAEGAEALLAEGAEVSAFYVKNVRF